MSDAQPFDYRYASRAEVHAIDTRVAVLENEIKAALARIERQTERNANPPPEMLSVAAAIHRGVAALEAPKNSGGSIKWVAIAVMMAAAAYAAHLMAGHW